MGLEIASFITDLVATNPASSDFENQGDDHIRLLKAAIKASLPNASRAEYFQTAVATSSNTVAVEADDKKVYAVTTTGGDKTFELPALVAGNAGWEVSVCKVTTDLNDVTVTPAAGTISGMASVVVHSPFQLVTFLWTGSIWTIKLGRLPAFKPLNYAADTALDNLVYGAIVTGDTSGADVVLTLPTAVGHLGESILFRRSGANDLTIEGNGSETINGELIYTLSTTLAMAWLVSDGANWMLVATQTGSTGAPAFTNVAQAFIAAQTFSDQVIFGRQTLVDGATIAWDMGEEPAALIASTASRTLGAPDNEVAGQVGFLLVTEDGTGGWVLTLNASYKTPGGGDIRPGVAASEATLYMYYVRGANDVLLWKVWASGRNSIGFYKDYSLGAFDDDSTKTAAHLLGRLPALAVGFLKCTTINLGYAVGDHVVLGHSGVANSDLGGNIWMNTTLVGFTAAADFRVVSRTTFDYESITASSWEVIVRVFE